MAKKIAIFLLFLFFELGLFASDIDNICAYPVPFNPKKHDRLVIGYPSGFSGNTNYAVSLEIFDINGDVVIKKRASQIPIYWNGRNASGRHVKPGMYILRLIIENDSEYGKKNIRIIVNY